MKDALIQKIYISYLAKEFDFSVEKFDMHAYIKKGAYDLSVKKISHSIVSYFNKLKTEAESKYRMRDLTNKAGVYVGYSNQEKLKLQIEHIREGIRSYDPASKGDDFSTVDYLLIRELYSPHTINNRIAEKKKYDNFESIKQAVLKYFKEQADTFKVNETLKHSKIATRFAENLLGYLPKWNLSDEIHFAFNWGELLYSKDTTSWKYPNIISKKEDSTDKATITIKRFDTRQSDLYFMELYNIMGHQLVKIVLDRNIDSEITLLERTIIDLRRQVNKINIINKRVLQVYIKGFSEPETIVFKNFEEAVIFEEKLIEAINSSEKH